MSLWLLQNGFQCSRPFYGHLSDGRLFDWLGCPYAIGGLGLTGVGMFVLVGGAVGLWNWSESWAPPVTWIAIVSPAMAAALLPGALLRRIAGVVTIGVAMLIIGLYLWWGRG